MQVPLVLIMVFFRILLCSGFDCNFIPPEVTPANKDDALIHYGWNGNTDLILEWLKCGANINAIDAIHGRTALMCASYNGHVEAVKVLLDKGSDVNIQSPFGEGKGKTASDLAGECKDPDNCSPGADINGENTDEIKQLLMAARDESPYNRVVAWIKGAWETIIFLDIPWKYVLYVVASVLILVLIIICGICLCKKVRSCNIECCECCDYECCWGEDDVMRDLVNRGERDTEKTTILQNSIRAWHGRTMKEDRLYFYYTSERLARRIARNGFTPTDMGHQTSGVYFSTFPPVPVPGCEWQQGFPEWPNQKFKKEILKLIAGEDAGCGCCSNRSQGSVDAVVIVKAPEGMARRVRTGVVFISDTFYGEGHRMMEQEIVKVVKLF